MQGYAIRSLPATKWKSFTHEVIGCWKFLGPNSPLSWWQLKGPKVEHTGVVEDEGSPVYLDGKLRWRGCHLKQDLHQEPIAGVTPFKTC